MQIIQTDKQKDSLAKFFWDMSKVVFTVLVIGQFAKPEDLNLVRVFIGIGIGIALALSGYILDGMEVKR